MFNTSKFNKEIKALPGLLKDGPLGADRQQKVKDKILLALKSPQTAGAPAKGFFWTEKYERVVRYAVSVLLGLSLVGGTAFATSGSALPGDFLYGVKIAKEKVQLTFAGSQEAKAKLKARFAANRLNELQDLPGGEELGGAAGLTAGSLQASTTTSSAFSLSDAGRRHLKLQAQSEARAEVKAALKELKLLHGKLKAQGDQQAAAGISGDILNLQQQARSENLGLDIEDKAGGGQEDRGSGELRATSTLQIRLKNDGNPGVKLQGGGQLNLDKSPEGE